MKLENLHSVYFLGIGGIGMSAIARWFHANGYAVYGYDKTPTSLTSQLEGEGIQIIYKDDLDLLPSCVHNDRENTLVVFTPAIPSDLKLYGYFVEHRFEINKRSQVLGMLTESKFTIAVAGTHGKTTTSSMIAHLLKNSHVDCSAFVGGIMSNYDSNLLIGGENDVVVVEADEFDRSFLTLKPDLAVITSVDADHLDIYGSSDALNESFLEFVNNIKPNGKLFIEQRAQDKLCISRNDIEIVTYSRHEYSDIYYKNLNIQDACFCFDYLNGNVEIADFKLAMPGFHNVDNALAAISAAQLLVKDNKLLVDALNTYKGVKRRFEYVIKTQELVMIDDYAHHPEEIRALLNSVRALYTTKNITVVFQPHLYSRTRDFASEFSTSLSLADKVVLLDIYPARELPIDGVSADILVENISCPVDRCSKNDVLSYIEKSVLEIVLIVGAGDIDTLVQPIKKKLLAK